MFITPNWNAPTRVKAYATTRVGGVSEGPYTGLNLGNHVGDSNEHVATNRWLLAQQLSLPQPVPWLEQVHGTKVIQVPTQTQSSALTADGSYSRQSGAVCCVMTADCLPVLLCNAAGTQVAAIHAGWRGLANGVLRNGIDRFDDPTEVIAWIGPAISQDYFEVGAEVRQRFLESIDGSQAAFVNSVNSGKYMANLPQLANLQLQSLGVLQISMSNLCTYAEPIRFYSYRRDGQTGRQACLIWLD
ncbi:peptidoglycan editing factor PgeF [Paraferrimonas haliotis]|uniref:Purine nucleoside phosphorylase n=1 Tax=Paraferrimonas haliotis TaxID=2013866 RepID=A0AA37TTU5_9GAMM|nr:peptidoglycan editing factor PgeF [Paraferrimonas haliotis]GLS82570.1 laccase domain protein [Paraferrimonas haliotis]